MSLDEDFPHKLLSDEKFAEVLDTILADLVKKINTMDVSAIPPMLIVLAVNKKGVKGTSMTYFSGFPKSEKDQESFFGEMGKSFVEKTNAAPYALFVVMEATILSRNVDGSEYSDDEGLIVTGMTIDKRVKIGSIHLRRNEDGNYVVMEVVTDPDRQTAENDAERWLKYVFAGAGGAMAKSLIPDLLEGLKKAVMSTRGWNDDDMNEHKVAQEAASLLARTKRKDFSNN